MKQFKFVQCLLMLLVSMSASAQWFTFSGGHKYYHLRDRCVNTINIEVETVNNVGTSFMINAQFGRDFINVSPLSFLAGTGIAINNNKMIRKVKEISQYYGISTEQAYRRYKSSYEYTNLRDQNKWAVLLALVGPTRFTIPVGEYFYMGPSWSLCDFTKIYDRKWEVTGYVGARIDYCPIPQMVIGAYGEYRYGWHRHSPYKGYALGISIGYRVGDIFD